MEKNTGETVLAGKWRLNYWGVTVRLRVTVWVMTSPVVELAVT